MNYAITTEFYGRPVGVAVSADVTTSDRFDESIVLAADKLNMLLIKPLFT